MSTNDERIIEEEARGWLWDCGMSRTAAYRLPMSKVRDLIERSYEGGWAGFMACIRPLMEV